VVLPVIGSIARLAANVAVAEPTLTGRVIAAWPSFALIDMFTGRCWARHGCDLRFHVPCVFVT
jgi:hypothetical protein